MKNKLIIIALAIGMMGCADAVVDISNTLLLIQATIRSLVNSITALLTTIDVVLNISVAA